MNNVYISLCCFVLLCPTKSASAMSINSTAMLFTTSELTIMIQEKQTFYNVDCNTNTSIIKYFR